MNICTLPGLERETWTTEPRHGHPQSPAGSPRPSQTAAAVLSVGDRTSTALSTPTTPACVGQERLHCQAATLRPLLENGLHVHALHSYPNQRDEPLLTCGVNPGMVAIPVVLLLPFSLVHHLHKVNIVATGKSE